MRTQKTYARKEVNEITMKISEIVKRHIAHVPPQRKRFVNGDKRETFNFHEIIICHSFGINLSGIRTVKVNAIEAKDGVDMDSVIRSNGFPRGGYYPSLKIIEVSCWYKDGKLSLDFYNTMSHEVNHHYQDRRGWYRMDANENWNYQTCYNIMMGKTKAPSTVSYEDWQKTKGVAFAYYYSRKNEIDSNIQGFSQVIDVFGPKEDGLAVVNSMYNHLMDSINACLGNTSDRYLIGMGIDCSSIRRNLNGMKKKMDSLLEKANSELSA